MDVFGADLSASSSTPRVYCLLRSRTSAAWSPEAPSRELLPPKLTPPSLLLHPPPNALPLLRPPQHNLLDPRLPPHEIQQHSEARVDLKPDILERRRGELSRGDGVEEVDEGEGAKEGERLKERGQATKGFLCPALGGATGREGKDALLAGLERQCWGGIVCQSSNAREGGTRWRPRWEKA